MAFKKNLMGSGSSAANARFSVGEVVTGVAAAGSSSQANSTAIVKEVTNVTTGAANTGVRLPANLTSGDWGVIGNSKAEVLFVYPPVGGTINGGSTNAKVDIPANFACTFHCINSLDFLVVFSTVVA